MKIKTSELLEVIDLLKEQIQTHFKESVQVNDEDFYWQIPLDELFDPTENPSGMTLGQLSDDWEELSRLLKPSEIPISYDLQRLSVIFDLIKLKSAGKW